MAAADRVRLPLLVYYPVMLLDRVALATIFGFFDSAASSELQLALLIAVHGAFMLYVSMLHPLQMWLLQWAEMLSTACEVGILTCALLLLQTPDSSLLPGALTAFYFVDVGLMVLPELIRYGIVAWRTRRKWMCCNRAAAEAPPVQTCVLLETADASAEMLAKIPKNPRIVVAGGSPRGRSLNSHVE